MAETGARRGMRDPVVPGSGLSVHTYHLTDYPPAADMEGVWMPAIGERSSDCEIVQQWDWSPEGSVLGSNCHGCYTEIRGRRHGTDVVLVLPLAEGAFSQGL